MKTKKYFGKKILSTLFLLCLITSTVSIQTNASEDINETLLQEKMCDFDLKKKLHEKKSGNEIIELYDETGRELFKGTPTGELKDFTYSTYDSFGKLQAEYGVRELGLITRWAATYVYDDNQKLEYKIERNENSCREGVEVTGDWDEIEYFITFYDDFGQCTSEIWLDSNEKEKSRKECTYDSNGNMRTKQVYDYGELEEVYIYDSNGNVLTEQNYYQGEERNRKVYTYDSNGNVLTEQNYYQGKERNRKVYTYDSNENVLTCQEYYGEKTIELIAYTYDSNGNMLTKQVYWGEELHEVYTYDSNGNVLTWQKYYNGNMYEREVYTYDSNGNVLSEQVYSLNRGYIFHIDQILYEYNQNGDILSSIDISYQRQNGSWVPYYYVEKKYEYDQDGDIIAEYNRNSLESDFTKIATYTYYPE